MLASAIANVVTVLLGIIARRFFVLILGDEYQGLNGLYTNVISMLNVVELGVGSAIIYSLYKPVNDNDIDSIRSLMAFYRKSYHLIGYTVTAIGLIIIPILPYITGEVTVDINATVVYLFFLGDAVCSYFLSYKRSILYARQENYIVQIIHIVCLIAARTTQTLILYITKNYYLYLVIMVALRVVENLLISSYVNRHYPMFDDKGAKPLEESVRSDIFTKIKGLFFHQIGSFVINGTDNLVITKFLGLVTAGLYSNYALIIDAVRNLAKQVIEAVTPSVGNLLVTESRERQFDVFRKMRFVNFWMAAFCGTCLYVLMEPWIIIWIGKERLLANSVMLILAFNFFQKTMRNVYISFKNAAGIFHEDRIVPIIESILNLSSSIILVKLIGLPGVFLGTALSGLVLWCYSYPKYIYRNLFGKSYRDYAKETIGYIAVFLGILFVTYYVAGLYTSGNTLMVLVVRLLVCLIIPNVIIIVLFHSNENFLYCVNLGKKLILKVVKLLKRSDLR